MVIRLVKDWVTPYWKLIALNLALIVVFSAVNGVFPIAIKEIVDAVQEDTSSVTWILFVVIGVAIAKAATQFGHRLLNARIFSAITLDMQKAAYDKVVSADMARHAREPAAALNTRIMGDPTAVRGAMEKIVNNLIRDGLTLIALVAGMIYIDWQLSLIVLVIFPIAIWPIAKIGSTLRKVGRQTQERGAAVSAQILETLSGIRVTKTYRLEETMKARTASQFQELRRLQIKAADHVAAIDPMLEIVGGLAVAGVLLFVGSRIGDGQSSFGDVAGFLAAVLMAAQPARALGNVNAHVQLGLGAAQRVYGLLDEPAKVVNAPHAAPLKVETATIRFEAMTFRYGDDQPALEEVNLTAEGGRKLALVGPSGAGKSTLLNLIVRLYDPTRGAVLIDGQDIRDVTVQSLRDSIALVSQDAILFNDTVRANIASGRSGEGPIDDARVIAAAKSAAAHRFIQALPDGYDTVIGDGGNRLSGGQRQRLSIARAFLRDAPILLLDEATSALDAESEQAIKDALTRLATGRTTLIIAHRLSTIIDADAIAVFDQGRLVEYGAHHDLLRAGGLYARLCALQFRDVAAE